MSEGAQLMLWIAGVHIVGLACVAVLMLPALKEGPPTPKPKVDGEGDDGWGRGPKAPPTPPKSPRGGIPLPDAVPARGRLRGPGRLSELQPRRERRPVREPARRPGHAPRRIRTAPGRRGRS